MEFNIWDLERVNVKVKRSFLDLINEKINLKFKTKREFYKLLQNEISIPYSSFKNLLKKSTIMKSFVPLDVYLNVVEKLELSKDELQRNILAYKTSGGINQISDPILPIIINPIFHAVFAHNIGDGTVINPKKGRLPYFGYRQFNMEYRKSYIKKIENVFGKILFKEDYSTKSTRVYCPPVLSTLFFKYYGLNEKGFMSETSRIPFDRIQDKDSLFAILLAFIIDEGHVDSVQIVINLKNKLLINDLKKICDVFEYRSSVKEGSGDYSHYSRLYILREGMKKLYSDYNKFNIRFPIMDLGWKGEKIKKSFEIVNRVIQRTKGNKAVVLSFLKQESLSVNQLADRLKMTRQGVRYHIHNLLKEGKIKLVDDRPINWVYGV